MPKWPSEPTWTPFNEINGGNQYEPADGLTAEDLNKILINLMYLQEKEPTTSGYTVLFSDHWLSTYGPGRIGMILHDADGTSYDATDADVAGKSYEQITSITFTEKEGEYWTIMYRVDGSDNSLSLSSYSTETLTLTADTVMISFSK